MNRLREPMENNSLTPRRQFGRLEKFDVGLKAYWSSASLIGIVLHFDSLSAPTKLRHVPPGPFQLSGSISLHRTIVRRVDIRRRKPDGPSLDGTAEATGEGQPRPPLWDKTENASLLRGGCSFLSFSTFTRPERSWFFLGGRSLFFLSLFVLIHVLSPALTAVKPTPNL